MVLKRWNAVRHKKTLLLVAFVILVVTIMAFLFVDEVAAHNPLPCLCSSGLQSPDRRNFAILPPAVPPS